MANVIKECRVCGNKYEACKSNRRNVGVFRWQEVACSPECGAIYLQRINESRGLIEQDGREKEEPPYNESVGEAALTKVDAQEVDEEDSERTISCLDNLQL